MNKGKIKTMSELIDENRKNVNIKNNLSAYRYYKRLTQSDMAKFLGTSLNTYRLIEKHNKYPKISIRKKLAKFFGVSENQLWFHE